MKELGLSIASILKNSINERGRASLAVPGGRSPIPLFETLANYELSWEKVDITLVDERWLPADDPRSNAYLLETHLLRRQARAARFVPLAGAEPTPEAGIRQAEKRLETMLWPLDAVVLGFGPDGHFASLFPLMDGIEEALDPTARRKLVATGIKGSPPVARISFSLSAILDCAHLYLLAAGEEKQAILHQARQDGPEAAFPLRALLRQQRTRLTVVPQSP